MTYVVALGVKSQLSLYICFNVYYHIMFIIIINIIICNMAFFRFFFISISFLVLYLWALSPQSFQINSKRHRAETSEVCCQWALLHVANHWTLIFTFTVQKYIYPSVITSHNIIMFIHKCATSRRSTQCLTVKIFEGTIVKYQYKRNTIADLQ